MQTLLGTVTCTSVPGEFVWLPGLFTKVLLYTYCIYTVQTRDRVYIYMMLLRFKRGTTAFIASIDRGSASYRLRLRLVLTAVAPVRYGLVWTRKTRLFAPSQVQVGTHTRKYCVIFRAKGQTAATTLR